MSKVEVISKSRKECRCNKCKAVIPVGSKYYRGKLNFRPDIVRCTSCGLEAWEVTTSDYQLSVGEILYRWQQNYGVSLDSVESIKNELENIKDNLQNNLGNIPENLQGSTTAELLQERIDNLDSAIDELDTINQDDLNEALGEDVTPESEGYEEELQELLVETIEEALNNIEL